MEAFANLVRQLDTNTRTNAKVAALAEYFRTAPDSDKVWTIAILSHRRPPRPVNTSLLRDWAAELAGIPDWLFEESYHIVGDLAETIALIVPSETATHNPPLSISACLGHFPALKQYSEAEKKAYVLQHWPGMTYYQRFVFTKLFTGGFRIGISQKLMTRSLSQATGIDEELLAYRLMGNWDPARISFKQLVLEPQQEEQHSKPFPFYLAYPLEDKPESLGSPSDWIMEHKWDGIRAQLIVRNKMLFLWSRGEELVTEQYPELQVLTEALPDGSVLDGELLPYPNGTVGSFKDLQKRLGRKKVSPRLMKDIPVILRAYDLLEWQGQDIRSKPFDYRREKLKLLLDQLRATGKDYPLDESEVLTLSTWDDARQERERSREKHSEGLMLKRRDAAYRTGRKKGDWWKWKMDPYTIDAVLTYAMRGHGRRSNLFTDYTFALWDENEKGEQELVTFAKAYSGLTDAELRQVDAWIKKNTLDRFGPVRSVTPHHVFEIAFEGIAHSKRHKSGVATRFPRILRWRKDKSPEEANSLSDLKQLIP
ncbi:ATP-dependent DNA ligase [Robiginitalea aurantiaca]|uniref:DNA ligase (ATP) n=1 Tax=Robiginitalea aurantiaca TaxID=3056915 RepID=A0ABT7WBA1_9FLAO|nr:ATP-dependent DNA ligase [Robiginitalea aurantiaca]MDM9630192.1 ATP-dependent DNA ligase [Robiginitalea aurantiaca]